MNHVQLENQRKQQILAILNLGWALREAEHALTEELTMERLVELVAREDGAKEISRLAMSMRIEGVRRPSDDRKEAAKRLTVKALAVALADLAKALK